MKYSLIVACTKTGVIGNENKIPWKVPEDMKLFRKFTTNNSVIMGRKTFQSLGSKALPNRQNIVITNEVRRSSGSTDITRITNPAFKDVLFVGNIEDVEKVVDKTREAFVIGGARVYNQFLTARLVNKIYLSRIKGDYKGDTYFNLDFIDKTWKIVNEEDHEDFTFTLLEK